jgi:Protein of unknown function with PCYCGC motif
MKTRFARLLFAGLLLWVVVPSPAAAMSAAQQQGFDRIMLLDLKALSAESAGLMVRKYPNEDWSRYNFPDYVHTGRAVETAYRIAIKEPEILAANKCYCFCAALGHTTLLSCFRQDGSVGGRFDPHASGCSICNGEAMLSFLWKNLGASNAEIERGLARKFENR